jgi:hypothetical protein
MSCRRQPRKLRPYRRLSWCSASRSPNTYALPTEATLRSISWACSGSGHIISMVSTPLQAVTARYRLAARTTPTRPSLTILGSSPRCVRSIQGMLSPSTSAEEPHPERMDILGPFNGTVLAIDQRCDTPASARGSSKFLILLDAKRSITHDWPSTPGIPARSGTEDVGRSRRRFPQTEAASAICSDTTSRPPLPGVYSDRRRSILSS